MSDRYGCISGFPDGTYRGNQPITRNEFAAGLNSCFEQIERDSPDAQLGRLWGKIDELRSRTMLLETNQFSTTTKINGDASFEVTNWDKD